jgi:hypothetical protein
MLENGGANKHAAGPPRCMVCNAKNTGRPVCVLPDVHRMTLVRCYLCVRHSLPQHINAGITNTRDLEAALANAAAGRRH